VTCQAGMPVTNALELGEDKMFSATNRNDGMLRLNVARHDNDDAG